MGNTAEPSAGASPDERGSKADAKNNAKAEKKPRLSRANANGEASADAGVNAENGAAAEKGNAAPKGADNGEGAAEASQQGQGQGQGRGRGRGRSRGQQQRSESHSSEPMNLTDLKTKSTQDLIDIAASIGLDNLARSRKQDIIFSILKRHAKSGEDIYGDGVLEILQDGFGFLRSADSSYLAGPDDIYVSAESDSPLQPAYRRHDHRQNTSTERQRALLRATQDR
jgi:transcription termination factor Rho